MTIKKTRQVGLELTPENIQGGGGTDLTREGEISTDSSDSELKVRLNAATRTVVTEDQTQVLTNKTIDADLNTISDLEVDNLKSGVLNVSTTLSGASDAQLPSALAVKTYIDDKAAAQNEASEISVVPAGTIAATNVQAALQELDTEKLSSAAGAVTGTNLEDIIAGASVGSVSSIPVITYDANGRITAASSASKITSGTAIATTSGTTHDFTSIPSTVKRITLSISGVSTNGTSSIMVQIGDSGGVENTGYLGSSGGITAASGFSSVASSAGFILSDNVAAASVRHGAITLTLLDSSTNTWAAQGVVGQSDATRTCYIGGSKPLSATLDRIRLTTVNGTDTFDAGLVNILYE